jgi:hypothetical protein
MDKYQSTIVNYLTRLLGTQSGRYEDMNVTDFDHFFGAALKNVIYIKKGKHAPFIMGT